MRDPFQISAYPEKTVWLRNSKDVQKIIIEKET